MRSDSSTLGPSSACIHAGGEDVQTNGALKPGIYMSNNFTLPADGRQLDWSGVDTYIYGRNGHANGLFLEDKLAFLEGAEACAFFASGIAALAAVFFTILKTGDHVVCSQVCYTGVGKMFQELLPSKYKIQVDFTDTTDLKKIAGALRPNTRLIHVETPGNPTTGISDIAAIAALAHEKGILLSVDGTFASPLLQKPLALGADLLIHSATKYINGHGDSLGGAVLGKEELIREIKLQAMVNQGGVISPFNAWLINRGLTTLALRMERHCQNAMTIAKLLESHPDVSFVAYPGLLSHPQHELACRQMSGFSGMLCFGLKADASTHYRFISCLSMITHAVSLGEADSLLVFTEPESPKMPYYPQEFRMGFFRFSVGLEDIQDLIGDLNGAFTGCGLKPLD